MSELVSSDDDSGKAAGVFDDGDAVDLLEPLVDDARAADVREAGRAAVALAVTTLRRHMSNLKNQVCLSNQIRLFRHLNPGP